MNKQRFLDKKQFRTNASGGAISTPISRMSTIIFDNYSDFLDASSGNSVHTDSNIKGYDLSYGRTYNHTAYNLAKLISSLEGKLCSTALYPSGMNAIAMTFITLCEPGHHVIIMDPVYHTTRKFLLNFMSKMNIKTTFFQPNNHNIESLIQKNTVLIYVESPASVTFELIDLHEIVAIAQAYNIIVIYDNSWSSPMFFKPLDYGVDISLCSLTKHCGGHSDVMLGSVSGKTDVISKLLNAQQLLGASVSPDDCYLVTRGIRTLGLRMKKHHESSLKVAIWLEKRQEIEIVIHPALKSHPDHKLWNKYFHLSNGLLSFRLHPDFDIQDYQFMIDNLKIFEIGSSWGGFNSLVNIFYLEDIRSFSYNRPSGHYIRLFCGLEETDDMINDLNIALEKTKIFNTTKMNEIKNTAST